jgi:hypothetical protein
MRRTFRVSLALAVLSLVAFSQPGQAGSASLPELIEELESWLDTNSPWPRRETPPAIRMLPPSLAAGQYGSAGYAGGRLRAFYDGGTDMITLVSPWDIRDPADQSVLLHELAHHRQAPHHWYCAGAQELPAYRLQAAWAEENGAKVSINWMAAVMESGCTRRDIHPD